MTADNSLLQCCDELNQRKRWPAKLLASGRMETFGIFCTQAHRGPAHHAKRVVADNPDSYFDNLFPYFSRTGPFALLHHSITPSLHHSITPSLHHSVPAYF